MHWIPIAAWIAAAVIAVVVLGFCGFEIVWKARRLQRDVAALDDTRAGVARLQAELAVTQERVAAARLT